MPKREEENLFVHELSAEHQQQITNYVRDFHKNTLLKSNEWIEILRKSKNVTEIFSHLNKINNGLGTLFIRNFPIEALTEGYEIFSIFTRTVFKDKEIIDNIILHEIKPKFDVLWVERFEENKKYIMTKIDTFNVIKKLSLLIVNSIKADVENYYRTFYLHRKMGYSRLSIDVVELKNSTNFQLYSLKLMLHDNCNRDDANRKKLTTLMKEYWQVILKKINAEKIDSKIKKTIKDTLLELMDDIAKKDKEFKEEMVKFLKSYLPILKKHLNFYATYDLEKIYPYDLPKINFLDLWNKRIIVDFYYQNKEFLDKKNHLKEKEQLFSLSKLNGIEFNEYCESIRSKTNKYTSFWKKFSVGYWINPSTEYDLYYEKLWIINEQLKKPENKWKDHNTISFKTNYVHNKMLDSLITNLEEVDNKISSQKLVSDEQQVVSSPKLDDASNKKNEEEIEKIEDSNTTVKPKIKTRKKANRSKITKKTKLHIKNKDKENSDEKQHNITTKSKKDSTQQNIKQIVASLKQFKSSEISNDINQMTNHLIKVLKNKKMISNQENNQLSIYLQIVTKIKQAQVTSNNKKIIEQIYNICSQNFSRVTDDNEKMQDLLSLVEQLELTNISNTKEKIHYYDYQRALPSIPLEEETSSSNSELDSQLISFNLSLTRKIHEYMIYNLNRDQELDHEQGRPAIYLGLNEQTKQHELIYGTSKVNKKKTELLNLKLSSKNKVTTYWYFENIIKIDNINNECIGDYWSRKPNNEPIDFLSNDQKEKLKDKINEMKDPTGMQQYFKDYENITKIEDEKFLESQKQEKKQRTSFNTF